MNLPLLPDDEDEEGDALRAEEIPSKQLVVVGDGAVAAVAPAAASTAAGTPRRLLSGRDSPPEQGAASVGAGLPVGERRRDALATVVLLRLQS